MTQVFNAYANYYDLIYQDKDYFVEAQYISSLIDKFNPSANTLLDMGCGTGIHASILASKDFQVTGIDRSKAMINEANDRIRSQPGNTPKKLRFEEGDIRHWQADEPFDVVTSLFHVISYQAKNDDLLTSLSQTTKNLRKNGIFIFDFWYGPCVLTQLPKVRVKRLENENIFLTRIAEPNIYFEENRVDVSYDILIKDKSSNNNYQIEETHSMRYFFLPELEYFLGVAGLKILASYRWLETAPLSENSWSGVIIAQKPGP